jgi:hypothetical protein
MGSGQLYFCQHHGLSNCSHLLLLITLGVPLRSRYVAGAMLRPLSASPLMAVG